MRPFSINFKKYHFDDVHIQREKKLEIILMKRRCEKIQNGTREKN